MSGQKQWEKLSPGQQRAVIGLGYNQQSWDSRDNPGSPKDIMYKSWGSLTEEERRHASTLGMDTTWFWKHVSQGAEASTDPEVMQLLAAMAEKRKKKNMKGGI